MIWHPSTIATDGRRLFDYFQQFPHVLPNDAIPILPAIKYYFWYRIFALNAPPKNPSVPFYGYFETITDLLPRTEDWAIHELYRIKWALLENMTNENHDNLVGHLWEATTRIDTFITGYEIEPLPETYRSKDVPKFSLLSEKATRYLSGSTGIQVEKVSEITNILRKKLTKVIDIPYRRMLKVDKVTSIMEVTAKPRYRITI